MLDNNIALGNNIIRIYEFDSKFFVISNDRLIAKLYIMIYGDFCLSDNDVFCEFDLYNIL